MSQKTIARLERLQQLNSNRQWVNHDLYRLMYQEDLYIIAYERIKSKPGNMTPGTDEETLDGFSLATIREIIQEMRTEQFRFRPVRQQFIPKPNGKMRKLGIPIRASYCTSLQNEFGIVSRRLVTFLSGSVLPIHPSLTVP
jgi:retron-type reverse transcriptase